DAAGEACVGDEVAQRAGRPGGTSAGDGEHPHVGLGAGRGGDGDLGPAVVVEVPGGHEHPGADGRGEGDEAGPTGGVGGLGVGEDLAGPGAIDDLDVGLGAGPGPADVVQDAVAVDVADADPDAALEGRVEGEEAGHQGGAVEHLDGGRALVHADDGQGGMGHG